ncbi:MAG: glycosyltransferase family 2 protein [bacterium]
MASAKVLFWVCVLSLIYGYVGYPILIRLRAMLRPCPPHRPAGEPTVSVLVLAHNEATRIARRIENLLALDYPRGDVEIIIVSDGSTDGTPERARVYEAAGVTVIPFETRRGKPAVLNDVVPKARGEIVVLADARQHFESRALQAIVAAFADPQVGAVSGDLILGTDGRATGVSRGIGFYWRYEKFIRKNESRVDSTVGATGAIYAIRRELFEAMPEDTFLDDVLIPLRITRKGYRVLFESGARAHDQAALTTREEFTRKVRTITGNFQLFAREPWLLNPLANRLWVQTVSHKGLRLLSPLFLAAALGSNLFLWDEFFYQCTLALQVTLYAAALAGYAGSNSRAKIPLLSIPYIFCLLNGITVVAFLRFISGSQQVTWEKARNIRWPTSSQRAQRWMRFIGG